MDIKSKTQAIQQLIGEFMQCVEDHPATLQLCRNFMKGIEIFQEYTPEETKLIAAIRNAYKQANLLNTDDAKTAKTPILCVGNIPIYLNDITRIEDIIKVFNDTMNSLPALPDVDIFIVNAGVVSAYAEIDSTDMDTIAYIIGTIKRDMSVHVRMLPQKKKKTVIQLCLSEGSPHCKDPMQQTIALQMAIRAIGLLARTKITLILPEAPYDIAHMSLKKRLAKCPEISFVCGNIFEYLGHGSITRYPTYPHCITHPSYLGICYNEAEGQHTVTIIDREMPIGTAVNSIGVNFKIFADFTAAKFKLHKRLIEMKIEPTLDTQMCILTAEKFSELCAFIESLQHQDCYTNGPFYKPNFQPTSADSDSDSD